MPDKPNQRGRQMTFRESDDRIVPLKSGFQSDEMKPSNIGGGKAARPLHDPARALPVLRDGTSVITRLAQIHQRAVTQKRWISSGWEPDALVGHSDGAFYAFLSRHHNATLPPEPVGIPPADQAASVPDATHSLRSELKNSVFASEVTRRLTIHHL